jgi:hypothetical protein
VENLEPSLQANHPRALIQMATGSDKTFTAISAAYRLIKFGGAPREKIRSGGQVRKGVRWADEVLDLFAWDSTGPDITASKERTLFSVSVGAEGRDYVSLLLVSSSPM